MAPVSFPALHVSCGECWIARLRKLREKVTSVKHKLDLKLLSRSTKMHEQMFRECLLADDECGVYMDQQRQVQRKS